jgi:hypothetical protein
LIVSLAAAASAAAPDARQDGRARRFRLEIFGGAGRPGLSDFNAIVAADEAIQAFGYDRLLDYQRGAGLIVGWSKSLTGSRGPVKLALPFGARIRWRLSTPLSLSLGLRLTLARRGSEYGFAYARTDSAGYEDTETVAYAPYRLSARFLAVLAGLHYARPLGRGWAAEAFIAAGPVFADCEHDSSWEYVWHKSGRGEDWDVFRMTGSLEEKGRGTGIAADAGVRLERPLGRRLALFVEGGYGLQAVRTVKGKGREVRGAVATEWEGTWAFKRETIAAPWGTLTAEFPTNHWPDGSASSRTRDFKLDASGLQARLGLAFRF